MASVFQRGSVTQEQRSMSSSHTTPATPPNKALQRILADLAREDQRTAQLFGKERSHCRKPLVMKVEVAPVINGTLLRSQTVEVWVRNLSRSGISYVIAGSLGTTNIGIHLLDGVQGPVWMAGTVVRERPMTDGYFECGVKFTETIAPPS